MKEFIYLTDALTGTSMLIKISTIQKVEETVYMDTPVTKITYIDGLNVDYVVDSLSEILEKVNSKTDENYKN